jgi:hypothetical protein
MLSSENERVYIHDFNDIAIPIIFSAWWVAMKVGLKRLIALNNS